MDCRSLTGFNLDLYLSKECCIICKFDDLPSIVNGVCCNHLCGAMNNGSRSDSTSLRGCCVSSNLGRLTLLILDIMALADINPTVKIFFYCISDNSVR